MLFKFCRYIAVTRKLSLLLFIVVKFLLLLLLLFIYVSYCMMLCQFFSDYLCRPILVASFRTTHWFVMVQLEICYLLIQTVSVQVIALSIAYWVSVVLCFTCCPFRMLPFTLFVCIFQNISLFSLFMPLLPKWFMKYVNKHVARLCHLVASKNYWINSYY